MKTENLVRLELNADQRAKLGERCFKTIELIVNNLALIPEARVPMMQHFFRRTNSNDRVPYNRLTEITTDSYRYSLNYTGDKKSPIQTTNKVGLKIHKTEIESGLDVASLDLTSFFDEHNGNKEFRWGEASMTDTKASCPPDSEEVFERIAIAFPELLVHPDRPRIISL